MNDQLFNTQNSNNTAKAIFCSTALIVFALVSVSFVFAQGAPRIPSADTNGNFQDMQVDGDRVKILSTTDGGINGKVRIKLDADGDWWRMLRLIDKNGNYKNIEQENGGYVHRKDVIEISVSELNDTFKLEFWKAKLFGVHTHMMTERFHKDDFSGRVVTFIWQEGLEDKDSDFSKSITAPINETLRADGKTLTIRSTNNGRKGYATIKLRSNIDWWTAVKLFDRSNEAKLIGKNKTLVIPIDQLRSEISLEFWTAKMFGVHTHISSKKLLRERFDGRIVTITWNK
ncbi:MAG: hypothetical protein R2681_08265 [Pyrinomonadaceae bacterium]